MVQCTELAFNSLLNALEIMGFAAILFRDVRLKDERIVLIV